MHLFLRIYPKEIIQNMKYVLCRDLKIFLKISKCKFEYIHLVNYMVILKMTFMKTFNSSEENPC